MVIVSTPTFATVAHGRGVARILGKRVLMYARVKRVRKFWQHPLAKWKGRSSNHHQERVLNVASELE